MSESESNQPSGGSSEGNLSSDRSSNPGDGRVSRDAGNAELEAPTIPVSIASLVGARLAGYQILRRLGRGGMADVFAARDMNLERDVAIKVLRRDLAKDLEYIKRFRREAKAAAKLNHTNIVQIYEVGEENEQYYIAQELIDGVNLREWLERNGALNAEQAVLVLYGVAAALDAAATEGITHRDIKPENVMWSKSGVVKVADFGLARLGNDGDGSRADLTQAGLTLGTPRYMSPEQVQGHPVDPRSDLYSLGVMMYHLLAGRPPFEANDPLALAFSHVNETPQPIDRVRGDKDIPEWLIAIVSKLLRKDPKERFQSPAELLDALTGDDSAQRDNARRLAGAATATARLQRVADEQKQLQFRKRARWVAIAMVPMIAIGLGAAAVSQARQNSVAKILRPDEVLKEETVEEQFIHAMSRNDEAAWKAVAKHFPPGENSLNRSYATKSALQLARHLESISRFEDADSTLQTLIDDPAVARKYRLVAFAWQIPVLQALSRQDQVAETKRQLETLYNELKANNQEAIEWFNRIVPPDQQESLGLSPDEGE